MRMKTENRSIESRERENPEFQCAESVEMHCMEADQVIPWPYPDVF